MQLETRSLQAKLDKVYGNHLLIDDKPDLGFQELDDDIAWLLNEFGYCSWMATDGLSAMKRTGDEIKSAISNSYDMLTGRKLA